MAFAAKFKSVQKQELSKPPDQRPKTWACSRMAAAAAGEARQALESAYTPFLVWLAATSCSTGVWRPGARRLASSPSVRLIMQTEALQKMSRKLLESDADSLAKVKDLLWSITQGQGELVYIPVGCILAERVMDRKDISGYLCRGIADMEARNALAHFKSLSPGKPEDQTKVKALISFSEGLIADINESCCSQRGTQPAREFAAQSQESQAQPWQPQ